MADVQIRNRGAVDVEVAKIENAVRGAGENMLGREHPLVQSHDIHLDNPVALHDAGDVGGVAGHVGGVVGPVVFGAHG